MGDAESATGPETPAARWKRIEDLFVQADTLPQAERAAFLETACTDLELRREVASLLANAADAPAVLHAAVGARVEQLVGERAAAFLGKRHGPYRLIELLGEGGMGAVYLAERDDAQYKRRVAIKILHHGLGSPQAIARFRDERQILAALDHPGIVRMLDGGATEDGQPYLVMEHIDGVPLTRYVRERDASSRECVELVRRVCAAVQYAHQKLVVHRDLKPSNILVGADGMPKLLDFGIAKLIDPEGDREARTQTGAAMLTPEYASPEQARGEAVSVATDVYSLGAVLYELLAGRPPHPRTDNALEMLRVICEVDPPRPSTVASESRRRELAGDLDNIVMKALHKEPARRYASIEQLDDDLGRYLDRLPVHARVPTFGYRAGKFVRRNRGVLAVAVIVAGALAAATVISIGQARRAEHQAARAEHRFGQVRTLANAMLFEFDAKLQNISGATEARQLMVMRALEYLDGLADESTSDPDLARELATAYIKVGDMQASIYEPSLGQPEQGLTSYRKATEIVDRLLASGHAELATQRLKATVMIGTGLLEQSQDQVTLSRRHLVEALAFVKTLPVTTDYDRYVLRAYLSLSYIERATGDPQAAAVWTAELFEVVSHWTASPDARYAIGIAFSDRADNRLSVGDTRGACDDDLAAKAAYEGLVAEHPDDARFARERAFSLMTLGGCRSGFGNVEIWTPHEDDLAGAESALREGVAIAEQLAKDRLDTRANAFLTTLLVQLGLVLAERDVNAAVPVFERARSLYLALPDSFQSVDPDRWFTACTAAESLARVGRREEAFELLRSGLASTEAVAAAPTASYDDHFHLQMCRYLAARADRALGDEASAAKLLDEVVATLDGQILTRPRSANSYVGAAAALELLAELRPAEACALRDRARATWRRWPGPPTPFIAAQIATIERARASCP